MEMGTEIVFCDRVVSNVSGNKAAPCVSKPLESISPISIPGNYTFSVFLSIKNVLQEHKELEVEIYNTENVRIFYTEKIRLEKFKKESNMYSEIIITTELRNVVIESTGYFTAKILLDGQIVRENKLEVRIGGVDSV